MMVSLFLKNCRSWALPDYIIIKLFSTLQQYACGEKELSLPWHPNMQVQEVIDILKIPDTIERVILVNSRYSEPDKELAPDDIIIIFPPVAGG